MRLTAWTRAPTRKLASRHQPTTRTTAPPASRTRTATTTTYVYDGFGDVIQHVSPDTGTTVYRYDLAGNLAQKTDAEAQSRTNTYDALDRVITTTYPADAAENVSLHL